MSGARSCTVVCDVAGGPVTLELALPSVPVTLAEVLALARQSERLKGLEIAWESAPVGVWGRECSRAATIRAGDRVEIYRLLPCDPKQARRARATAARRASGTVK
jgi:putative ubiquitin-RnfH superfamily antitoxin RatB of RatAB toxin-antitoxin module